MIRNVEETPNRVSVWVVESGYDETQDRHGEREPLHTHELAVMTQHEREDAAQFAERVHTKVTRMNRKQTPSQRLALVLQDDQTSTGPQGVRSEALTAVALHLMRTETSLTIRFADE